VLIETLLGMELRKAPDLEVELRKAPDREVELCEAPDWKATMLRPDESKTRRARWK
jgi:hypothetical protein